jgi:hypothetical protein
MDPVLCYVFVFIYLNSYLEESSDNLILLLWKLPSLSIYEFNNISDTIDSIKYILSSSIYGLKNLLDQHL